MTRRPSTCWSASTSARRPSRRRRGRPDLRRGDHDNDKGPDLPTTLDPDTPSVLYLTSGTTGAPKVVARTHAAIVSQALMSVLVSEVVAGDCIAVTYPLAFGASAVTLFSAWFIGATPCFYDLGRRGVDGLMPWLREHEIVQTWPCPPSCARSSTPRTRPSS